MTVFMDILKWSFLTMSGLLVMNIMDVISLYYIGSMNDVEHLAAIGLGIVTMNIVIVSIM